MNPADGTVTNLRTFADPEGSEVADLSLASNGMFLVKGSPYDPANHDDT